MEALNEVAFSPMVIDRSHLVEQVRRWGGLTSDAVLDPAMQIYTIPEVDGFIGYRLIGKCAVAFGDPLCKPEDKARLAFAFHYFNLKQKQSVVYISCSESFAKWAIDNVCSTLFEFGQELIFDPPSDPKKKTGNHGSLVRRKVKQAIREGLTVCEHTREDLSIERKIEEVGEAWLQSRKGIQLHISNVYLFADCHGKRWFYAKRGEEIVGVITLNHLQSSEGWLINHLMVTPNAPNGTSEILVATVLETLEREHCPFATVGVVTTETFGEISGLNAFSTWLARVGFCLARKLVNLDGLQTFWGKYSPQGRPTYVLFSRNRVGLRELRGLSKALGGRK
jgi:lysylphosphatidylglycerol synthetase-like protein (DUF2156 family)